MQRSHYYATARPTLRQAELVIAQQETELADIDALQAKVAEQSAEIERLQSKLDLLVIERDAQAVLISDQQDDVEKQTEISNNFAAQVRQQDEIIASLRAEVDHRQSLLRESNRNCAEHAGVVWTRNVTIAQQSERIAELDEANEHHRELARVSRDAELNAVRIAVQQAELIEKCRDAMETFKGYWYDALAAIAAQKGGSV